MAWAQRSEVAASGFGAESYVFSHGSWGLVRAQKCAQCTSLIAGEAVIVNRGRYCSIDCSREATQAKNVPGHYLG
ncbi:MAG: hypothetical protein DLM67_24075 [Candidatus Nephthysia bennettiae]|uniref:hypothetical protein n=1 Tax=Candidatus Nephthysia bennettiae TaxID=3127016 RepID=UPI000DB02F90|nr:MAG: hypothetical protein DLM67_24075 [Candidatus Dormibacteraeota bacterium]